MDRGDTAMKRPSNGVQNWLRHLSVSLSLCLSVFACPAAHAQLPPAAPPCATCGPGSVNPCQPPIQGVDCAMGTGCGEPQWKAWAPIPWQAFGQGEYTGPARSPHVPEYRIRVDDLVEFVYRLKRDEVSRPYLLDVGDEIQIDSLIDEKLNRKIIVQP